MLSLWHLIWMLPVSATVGAFLMAIVAVNNIDFYESVCTKLNVKVKKLYSDAVIPTFGSEYAAGADLYAYIKECCIVEIPPHETVKIGTGVAMAIPHGFWGGIFARSGLATKRGLAPANKVGVIDPDYRGEIIVALHNDTNEPRIVAHGDRIGQLVIVPVPATTYTEVEDLDETERGDGGFGHTGI